MKISIENPKNKDRVTFLETSRGTGGARTLMEVELAPGGRNALHYHTRFSERFEAVEGDLQLATAEGTLLLKPGESFTAPPYAEHCFFNDRDAVVRFRVEITPANAAFEDFLQVAYGLINDTWTLPGGFPLNPLHLGVLYRLGDTHYRGPLQLMTPMAELTAWLARRVGTQERLLRRYSQTRALPP